MKEDRIYLLHIRDCAERIFKYTQGGKEDFLADSMIQDAVVRNLEIIGEAVKRISEHTRNSNPDIQWKQIAGMRDKMIHDYFGVNLDLIWIVVEKDLHVLNDKVKTLLEST